MHLVFDLYPRTAPLSGGRLVRFSQLKEGSFYRRVPRGTGFGLVVLPGDGEDAQFIDPEGLQFVRALDLDLLPIVNLAVSAAADDIVDTAAAHGLAVLDRVEFPTLTGGTGLAADIVYYVHSVLSSTSFKVAATRGGAALGFSTNITAGTMRRLRSLGGFWTTGGNFDAAVRSGKRDLQIGGAGTFSYTERSALLSKSYLTLDSNPGVIVGQDPFDDTWRFDLIGPLSGIRSLGGFWHRILREATEADRGSLESGSPGAFHELPDLTVDFTGFLDSDGEDWIEYDGEFRGMVGEDNVMSMGERLMQLGLYTDMDADDFTMRAYLSYGRDLTGASWAADVVRFQVATDGTTATGNIVTDAVRAIAAAVPRKRILVGSEDHWRLVTDPTVTVEWTGGMRVDPAENPALDAAGTAQLQARIDAGDVPRIRIPIGNDPEAGLYTPGPRDLERAHVWDNDLVNLHSGSDKWDWDEATARVAALEWQLVDRPPGDNADVWLEFGSTFQPFDRRFESSPSAGGPGHAHGPHIRLCDPFVPGSSGITERYNLNWEGGNDVAETVAIYPSGTGDWPISAIQVDEAGPGDPDADGSGFVEWGGVFGADAGSPRLPATAGETYRWAGQLRSTCPGDGTVGIKVNFHDVADGLISSHQIATIVPPADTWAPFSTDLVAPVGTVYMRMVPDAIGICSAFYDKIVVSEITDVVEEQNPYAGVSPRAARCDHSHPAEDHEHDADYSPLGHEHVGYVTTTDAREDVTYVTAPGATHTIEEPTANIQDITLDDDTAVTMPTPVDGKSFTGRIRQDGVGGRVPDFIDVLWPGGTPPTWSTDPDAIDFVSFLSDGVEWYGHHGGAVSGPLVAALDDLSDVTISAPAELDTLRRVGGQFVNDARIWRPLMDGLGNVVTDSGTGEAIMALS